MFTIPTDCRYTKTHEWVRLDDDGAFTIGITDHAQELLGDVVFVELPNVDAELRAGDEAGVIESVKAASDLYAPLAGQIIAVNELLDEQPDLINQDAYGGGWIFRMKALSPDDWQDLLDASDYQQLISGED